jgi:Bacterial toxin 44
VSFANNRSDYYAYDADGRVLVSYIGVTAANRIYYQYDARGQKVEARLGNNSNLLNHGFDGDGQWIKVINTKVENSVTTTAIGYEVRSSVLRGQVIQDLNAQGAKTQQHVYTSGGSELAAGNAETTMIFKHIDPITGTEQLSWTDGRNNGRTELDPVGGDVGLQPPDVEEPDTDLPTRHGSLGQPANRCADGGMSSDCNSVMLGGYDPVAFWGYRIADLPGFGTTWGSMVEWGARAHAARIQFDLWQREVKQFILSASVTVKDEKTGEILPGGEGSRVLHLFRFDELTEMGTLPQNYFVGTEHKKQPCPPIPTHPTEADINANIDRAKRHIPDGPLTAIDSATWFRDMVQGKGSTAQKVKDGDSWNYKKLGSQYEDFGNFNYGATGRAIGFSEYQLQTEAGRAQIAAGTSKPGWGKPPGRIWGQGVPPYGDDPYDQAMIKKGFEYYYARQAGCGP